MKLYGYANEKLPTEIVPVLLHEVTLCARPHELRQMAIFLASCADEMERMGSNFNHVHLADRLKEFRSAPHFVVAMHHADED